MVEVMAKSLDDDDEDNDDDDYGVADYNDIVLPSNM